MKTTVKDVCVLMELLCPQSLAQEWDNVGLMVGSYDMPVKKIMTALDMSPQVAEQAVAAGADMIVTHHPLFFQPLKTLALTDAKLQFIYELIKHDIAVFSAHTNLDAAPGGVNDVLAERLSLHNVEVMPCAPEDTSGIGRVGILVRPITLAKLAQKVKRDLKADGVAYVDAGKPVYKVAVIGGGGSEFMQGALAAGADTLVTGDVKYHGAKEALLLGLNIVDGGHQFTERPVADRLMEVLSQWSEEEERGLEIIRAEESVVLCHL